MQLRAFLFLSLLCFAFSTVAQNYTGIWEGNFYMRGKKNKINVRIEMTQNGTRLHGVVSTRGFEKNTAYGCDYIVSGWIENDKMILGLENVQRGVAMTKKECGSFKRIELYPTKTDSSSMAKGRWFWIDDSKELLVVKKTGSAMSDMAWEEMENVNYKPDPPTYIVLKNEYMPLQLLNKNLGTYSIDNKEVTIVVSSLQKNPKATMTVTMNDRTVSDNFHFSDKVLVIRFADLQKVNKIDFINNSDRRFQLDVKISFQQEGEKKDWIVSITPGGTAYLELKRKD